MGLATIPLIRLLVKIEVTHLWHLNVRRDSCNAGIMISSTPIAVDNATADVGILLMLGALRSVYIPVNNLMNHGGWGKPIGHDPEGKTLGILGMGGIGRVSEEQVQPDR